MARTIDMLGKTFGQWTVLSQILSKGGDGAVWRCQCSCGSLRDIHGGALRAKQTLRCITCQRDAERKEIKNEDRSEYRSWRGLRSRCCDPKDKDFHNYGGRGIKVCSRWNESFENFYADMGPKPSPKHSIDRKNNNDNYEPGNCRWATTKEQQRNTRANRPITFEGQTKLMIEWAELMEMPYTTLYRRLKKGWPVERALTQPMEKQDHSKYRKRKPVLS